MTPDPNTTDPVITITPLVDHMSFPPNAQLFTLAVDHVVANT
jgi:hypothetical protein